MFCQKCGAELPDDAKKCIQCGTQMYGEDEIELERKLEKLPPKQERRRKLLPVVICLIFLCGAFLLALDYFDVLDIDGTDDTNGGIVIGEDKISSDFFVTVEEQREQNSQKTSQSTTPTAPIISTPTPTKSIAEIVYPISSNFFGEWVLVGYKDYVEDEIVPVDNTYNYVILKSGTATHGKYGAYYTDDIVHTGPSITYFNYKPSGGINNYNYIDMPSGLNDYMMDSEGHLLSINYLGNGKYETGIQVYERRDSGSIESYLNSHGKSLYDGPFEKDDFSYSPIGNGQPLFAYIPHWNFVGFAENPYINTSYDTTEMLKITGNMESSWQSNFKINEGGWLEYFSSTVGDLMFNAEYTYSDGYNCNYFKVVNNNGIDAKSMNIFIGIDSRAYVSIASDDNEHLCLSHFYVYEMFLPDAFSRIYNHDVTVNDFMGTWKSVNKIYYMNGTSISYDKGNFDIFSIMSNGDLQFIQNIRNDEIDTLTTYDYNYNNQYYYLEIEDFYGDAGIRQLYYINNDGQLVVIEYKMEGNNPPHFAYSLYDRFDSTLDECIDSFN